MPRMQPRRPTGRFLALGALTLLGAALAAGPVLGVDPSPATDDGASSEGRQGPPIKPPGQAKERVPTTPIALSGTVSAATDEDGRTTYTLASGGKTYELGAGPHWWWGSDHPLAPHVGDQVEVVGEIAEGSNEIEVESVDGVALRAPGKPPWAGGPKSVGERHPGWKAWSEAHPDGKPGNGHGRDAAPGQQKKAEGTED
jgi:hypothetical protein